MNIKEARMLIGQIFARRLPRDPSILDLYRFPVANYIVFKDALVDSFEASKRKLEEARERVREEGIEPLFMMDEEGGRVTQVSGFFSSAPSCAAVARALDAAEARELYYSMSKALAVLGIDVNLAPCADVNTEPLNPIIGPRSFGSTREAVETYTRAFVEAARPFIGCVAKHFPGHGMTKVDSHLAMPAVDSSLRALKAIHMPPFARAIDAGADGLMVGHCHYSAIQKEARPASLSNEVVRGLLRRKLGFEGWAITDSLDMEAITSYAGPREASRAAFDAGIDMLLYTENSKRFEQAFESMVSDLLAGTLDRERLAESTARRQSVLRRLKSRPRPTSGVAHERYLELRDRVLAGSVRVYDKQGLLPIVPGRNVYVTTDPHFAEQAGRYIGASREISAAGEAKGRSLILWLLGPLRLKHSLAAIREMIDASKISLLVTSYRSLADNLAGCDVKIVTDDTSPETRSAILNRLFRGV